jgi:hypothetical protein
VSIPAELSKLPKLESSTWTDHYAAETGALEPRPAAHKAASGSLRRSEAVQRSNRGAAHKQARRTSARPAPCATDPQHPRLKPCVSTWANACGNTRRLHRAAQNGTPISCSICTGTGLTWYLRTAAPADSRDTKLNLRHAQARSIYTVLRPCVWLELSCAGA